MRLVMYTYMFSFPRLEMRKENLSENKNKFDSNCLF